MKKGEHKKTTFNISSLIVFFILIACVIQSAVLIFDFVKSKTQNNLVIALIMLGVIIVLSLICTVIDYIRRKISVDKPIEEILSATDKISKGDFSVKLTPSNSYGKYNGYDYVKFNINVMAEELSKSEILKTDFISGVSHELKTPLSVIKNYCNLLKGDNLSSEEKQKYLNVIINASDRLTDLINNILKLNKLENGEARLVTEKFYLTETLSNAVLTFEEKIESKNITLNCDFDDVYITSNEGYLDIVFSNLISNAVKFTSNGGEIYVTLKKEGDRAIISVKDNGIGIPDSVGSRIFDKFYQADLSRAKEGNGLGLALVKKVIDILGGEILVSSVYGEGAEFTVIIKGVL